jgi:hypothetical protein
MQNPFHVIADAFTAADKKLTEEIQAKVTIGTEAALAEVPILADLLRGQEVTLTLKLQFTPKP